MSEIDAAAVPLVEVTRAGVPESVHRGVIVVADAAGRVLAGCGDPHSRVFARSALKPLQALALVESGALDAFGLGEQMLALACASHAGEPMHTERIGGALARIGARVEDLGCGSHVPLFLESAPSRQGPFSALHHNCSGKHTGFLAVCRHCGWSVADYLDPGHPLQQRVRAAIEQTSDCASLTAAIDGCSAPTYALPLAALACAYARVALAPAGSAAARIRAAMTAHPLLVSGTGRADTFFMQAGAGGVLAKGGAEGVQALALPAHGLGVAIKVADGAPRAATVAAAALLARFGILDPARATHRAWIEAPLRNARGTLTGTARAVFRLAL